jgi:hypothetical protein
MANIEINDLKPAGAELFDDSEGFMDGLSNDELGNVLGGRFAAAAALSSLVSNHCICNAAPVELLSVPAEVGILAS